MDTLETLSTVHLGAILLTLVGAALSSIALTTIGVATLGVSLALAFGVMLVDLVDGTARWSKSNDHVLDAPAVK
jgi:hypothetical protein